MILTMTASLLLSSAPNTITKPKELPYAPLDLIYQSADAIERAHAAFETSADADLDRFVDLSKKGNYTDAYRIWSDLIFRYNSFRIELWKTIQLSTSDQVKGSVYAVGTLSEKVFQEKILAHSALFDTFLQNANASDQLTPQQREFTENILKEYEEIKPNEAPKITPLLQKLEKEKTASFAFAKGMMAPINPDALSELKVFNANILCFPGMLGYMFGGVRPWKERIDKLVEIILNTQAQIVCLQEVWDPKAMLALADRLKNDYAFFIYDAGDSAGTVQVKKMCYSSGLFLASKIPLDSIAFNRFPRSVPEGSKRGAIVAKGRVGNEPFAFVTTHLQHSSAPPMHPVRQEQLFLCYAYLQEMISGTLSDRAWGFLAGDLNINAFSPEFNERGITRLFSIPYTTHLTNEKATCTDYFNDLVIAPPDQRDKVPYSYEMLDYCIRPTLCPLLKNPIQKLIPLYNLKEPLQALSDHQGLLTTWTTTPTTERKKK